MSDDGVPAAYTELISVLEALPLLVRETRRRKALSLRAAAVDSGVQMSTLQRCEQGAGMHLASVVPLLRWVGGDPR